MTKKQKKILIRIIVATLVGVASYITYRLTELPVWAEILLFVAPYLVVGYDVILSAGKNIIHGQVFNEKFLMVVATVGAFVIREYPEAMAVMILYQAGELFQSIAVGKSRKSISSLMDMRP
ncbi:MAG: heavy metal translocating P-type ATPase, partial [Clostridia bacterium]|nr:heavy metal translocating P-type ATPase [Clostridia bacterium]